MRALKVSLTLAALTLAACSAVPADRPGGDLPARARYMPYVGAPLESFNWMMSFDGWEALSDSELILFLNPDTAYYLRVWAPCGTTGLRWAHVVGLTSSPGGTVTARLDSLRTQGTNCPISEIRKLDYRRFLADARAARHAAPGPATAQPQPQPW